MKKLLLVLLLYLKFTTAHAELIYYNNYVWDTESNYDWLKLSLTHGQSLDNYYTQNGWKLAGADPTVTVDAYGTYLYVSPLEFLYNSLCLDCSYPSPQFFKEIIDGSSIGYSTLRVPNYDMSKAHELASFMWGGTIYEDFLNLYGVVYDDGTYFNWAGLEWQQGEYSYYGDINDLESGTVVPGTYIESFTLGSYTEADVLSCSSFEYLHYCREPYSWWLYRNHVPLPASAWLFFSALLGLIQIKRVKS